MNDMNEWNNVARHKCGDVIYLPFGSTTSLTAFGKICPKCGEKYCTVDLECFIGRQVWKGKWYNPLTWLDFEWEKK